ncbi:methenyltetrahydrofolate synthase domain-containing protein isoform X3 [Lontra canadensis]|uniref:methenyltetrahydrofolate synthase domain-containing protein isoform X3 n=1 Tax=Lontra canadensis TaxID=76717 RepID=UPI0013F2D91B|nr:methenyltetrahydrofolate synthase domain-containing protein isoform X3 [Lontra canadensis]
MALKPGVSKQDIRQQIWDYMESQHLADFPRPVHHRIPNFKGSYLAGQSIRELEVFARAQEVKVDPDKPLEGVRLLALQSKKTLLVPTPRLRTGLFNKITPPPGATKDILRTCATSQGVRSYSTPVGLDSRVLVDLVVVGSVAVSEKGWRIGKGEGYADLEYAMMVSMGAVSQGTPVVTIVHDCQVVDIPEALLEDHDLTVDYILTPTRVIVTGCERPKPTGIIWSKGCAWCPRVGTRLLRIPLSAVATSDRWLPRRSTCFSLPVPCGFKDGDQVGQWFRVGLEATATHLSHFICDLGTPSAGPPFVYLRGGVLSVLTSQAIPAKCLLNLAIFAVGAVTGVPCK